MATLRQFSAPYRVQGSGHERGVDLWAQLDHPAWRPRDLSAYAGIRFSAKLEGGDGRIVVAMNPGGSYFDADPPAPSVAVELGTDWGEFSLPFTLFGIDGSSVASFDFVAGDGGTEFDLWVDDVGLLCRAECPKFE